MFKMYTAAFLSKISEQNPPCLWFVDLFPLCIPISFQYLFLFTPRKERSKLDGYELAQSHVMILAVPVSLSTFLYHKHMPFKKSLEQRDGDPKQGRTTPTWQTEPGISEWHTTLPTKMWDHDEDQYLGRSSKEGAGWRSIPVSTIRTPSEDRPLALRGKRSEIPHHPPAATPNLSISHPSAS
jgi:hypothetical protein